MTDLPVAFAADTPANGQLGDRARASVQLLLNQHNALSVPLQSDLQNHLGVLSTLDHKLSQGLIQVAAFGFVSRGKSAVLNALFAEPIFPIGPLNGETQWPRSVRWSPPLSTQPNGQTEPKPPVQIELIDTPGLDEISGDSRAQMAREIAETADLILFIVAGLPSPQEIEALIELCQACKPLLLVVNKADLYPDLTPETVYQALPDSSLRQLLSAHEIFLTAAAPAPVQVRVEWPDGHTTEDWEVPPPQIQDLQQTLLHLLNQEGQYLRVLNTLRQAQTTEEAIARRIAEDQSEPAMALIWKFIGFKALVLACNPLVFMDLLVGGLCDLLLIGALVKRYGLPTPRHGVSSLWQTLIFSWAGLAVIEIGSGTNLGFGSQVIARSANMNGFVSGLGAAIAQASIAAYGAYLVGQATQKYLIQGSTWGPLGPSTLLQQLLSQLQPDMILYRLRQNLLQPFGASGPD